MSPRSGGEAEKIGHRYEGAWTVRRLLDVVAGDVEWVRVEPLGDVGRGVEFVLRRRDGGQEVHQVKRQFGNANEWNVGALTRLRIWETAQRHSESGYDYHFVSMVPFRPLQELTERMRNSNDYVSFVRGSLPSDLNTLFNEISNIYGDPDIAYRVLRKFHVRLIDEHELRSGNGVLAQYFLEGGSGRQASASLGEVVDDNIDVQLTADRLFDALRPYELRPRLVIGRRGFADRVRLQTTAWQGLVGRQLIHPVIVREEAEQLRALLLESPEMVHFLVGAAGGGKTAVLHEAVRGLVADDVPTLVLRLDRYGTLASTADLGRRLDLDVSPVTALAAAAEGRPSVLVVDQLDAVSLASGRLPENFDVVAELVTEAVAFPDLNIVLGCRQFDVDNDHRIRSLRDSLKSTVVTVAPLTDEQVRAAVDALGLPITTLSRHQFDILRLPLHLALLATVANDQGALDFTSTQRLYDAYWEHKRRAARRRQDSVRFDQVVGRLAEVISERQELAVPIGVLDVEDLAEDAAVLVSEQLLVRDGQKVAFFHEAMFDYAFARQWVNRGESMVDFLLRGEQELFRRGQVRQIMMHLRSSDHRRFIKEVRALLTSDQIRFHIKAAALAVVGGIADPTVDEADMLLDVATDHPPYEARLWNHLRTPAWFNRLDADGHIAAWLQGDEDQQSHALNLMTGAAATSLDRVAELLANHREQPEYPSWLRWVVRYTDLKTSRPMFELFLEAIRLGHYAGFEHQLWLSVHDLAEEHPEWAVEVLTAFFIDRPGALEQDEHGRIAALKESDYTAAELIKNAAAGAPEEFCAALLAHIRRVMEISGHDREGESLRMDSQFSRYTEVETSSALGDVLFVSMAAAIRVLVVADPEAMRSTLESLAEDRHYNAQWLLYQGLVAGGVAFAEWSAQLLLEGRHRLLCGPASNGVWTTRQVLQAISPVVSDELFARLEAEVRDLRFPWEKRQPGWYAFNLLSALDEDRLSDLGRRRLGELRRAIGMAQPPEPEGVVGGMVGPPIPPDAARHMSDDNWLQAMVRHSGEQTDWRTLTGGALEQSRVLLEQVKQDPSRFARLALRLTRETNPAYGDAVLMGLGEANPVADESLVYDAMRHIASFGYAQNDRWLGSAVRPYFKTAPLDIVELIRDRAVATTDPSDDGIRVWSEDPDGRRRADIRMSGINTARGSLAEALASLLTYDLDGKRTALAVPVLDRLAQDQSVPVRSCVARLIGAAMRHAREEATEAFWRLIETDDALLATEPVMRLIIYLGNEAPDAVQEVIERMLTSSDDSAREAGGKLAAFAAMEWDASEHLRAVLDGADSIARKGAAETSAHRLPHTANFDVAATTLALLVNDLDDDVRKKAAEAAGVLRDHDLRPFEAPLKALMASPAFNEALPQLLITLERAPDKVDDLVLLCAQSFVEVYQAEAGDIRTRAAADSREVGQLIIRGLAQSSDLSDRAALLDVLDSLLLIGAYGIDDMVSEAER